MPVYAEYTPKGKVPAHMSDVVPWRAVLAPGVVLQKDQHGLQRTYALRGPDVQGETPEVQGALMLQANEVLKRLGGAGRCRVRRSAARSKTCPRIRGDTPSRR